MLFRSAAEQAAGAFYTAQQEYFDASIRADTLQSQADLEAQNATDAANKAGRIAAQLYRDGGDTTSLELFLSGSAATADDLLSRLGVMDKLLERNQAVYAAALTARDAAQSLTDQAVVARDERDRLQQVAEQKMLESQQAADAAQAALDAQTLHLGELQAQLDQKARDLESAQAANQAQLAAARRALLGGQRQFVQALGPVGNQAAMRGAGDRVFVDAHRRGEEARDEILLQAPRGDDHSTPGQPRASSASRAGITPGSRLARATRPSTARASSGCCSSPT